MTAFQEHLNQQGIFLTKEGLEKCIEETGGKAGPDLDQYIQEADLKEIGAATLPTSVNKGSRDTIKGPIMLQIVSARNISVPASRNTIVDDNNRILSCKVTDGHIVCNAIEMKNISALSHKPHSGTKIVVTNAPIRGGYILLSPNVVKVIGGKGHSDEWEVSHAKPTATTDGDAPPPFVLPELSTKQASSQSQAKSAPLQPKKHEQQKSKPTKKPAQKYNTQNTTAESHPSAIPQTTSTQQPDSYQPSPSNSQYRTREPAKGREQYDSQPYQQREYLPYTPNAASYPPTQSNTSTPNVQLSVPNTTAGKEHKERYYSRDYQQRKSREFFPVAPNIPSELTQPSQNLVQPNAPILNVPPTPSQPATQPQSNFSPSNTQPNTQTPAPKAASQESTQRRHDSRNHQQQVKSRESRANPSATQLSAQDNTHPNIPNIASTAAPPIIPSTQPPNVTSSNAPAPTAQPTTENKERHQKRYDSRNRQQYKPRESSNTPLNSQPITQAPPVPHTPVYSTTNSSAPSVTPQVSNEPTNVQPSQHDTSNISTGKDRSQKHYNRQSYQPQQKQYTQKQQYQPKQSQPSDATYNAAPINQIADTTNTYVTPQLVEVTGVQNAVENLTLQPTQQPRKKYPTQQFYRPPVRRDDVS